MTEKPTILIVDDEPDLRELIAMTVKKMGYNVLQAASGNEAYELIQTNKVHMVISDIRMPDGNGVELLDKVKQFDHDIPVVSFITGFADLSFAEAYSKGAESILSKPFERKKLIDSVVKSLTPKSELWAVEPDSGGIRFSVSRTCTNIHSAMASNELNFGRGGAFIGAPVLNGKWSILDDLVEFKFEFSEGPIKLIEGVGITRWARREPSEKLPHGFGIEFLYLTEATRLTTIEFLKTLNTVSFIPIS